MIRNFYKVKRADSFRIVPIGCTHCGNVAAEEHEPGLKRLIAEIVADPYAYVILMGDACEFINTRDKRFDAASLASWINVGDLVDLAKVQYEYYLELMRPLAKANKILAITSGNHEESIKRYSERDVYSQIVSTLKGWQKMRAEERLGVGMSGWLALRFSGGEKKDRGSKGTRIVRISLHHGFVGGRLSGAKALNMQRWLWSHDCDVAMMGHSHDIKVLPEAVEKLNVRTGKVWIQNKLGLITGNWLGRAAYASDQGYLPLPVGYTELMLYPRTQGMRKMSAAAVIL